jgi:hypothetical protein
VHDTNLREAKNTAIKSPIELTLKHVNRGTTGWLGNANVLDDLPDGSYKRLSTGDTSGSGASGKDKCPVQCLQS